LGKTNGNFDYLKEEKKLEVVQTQIVVKDKQGREWRNGPTFPMDSQASYVFYSKMEGFVPPEVAVDTIFTGPLHYGVSGFEGIRFVRTKYGDGFVELGHNIGRFVYSELAFNQSLITDTINLRVDPSVTHVEHLQRTPREFFEDAAKELESGGEIKMGVEVFHRDGTSKKTIIPFRPMVKFGDSERVFSLREMESAICSLAYLNHLVREGEFPDNKIDPVPAGYFRPFFWVSGEDGLKVPTVTKKDGKIVDKTLYLAIGTLGWPKRYLDEAGYGAGLDVLIAPLPRPGIAMPVTKKIGGVYVNSAININIGMKLGFGEILAVNYEDRIVEGSAENIVILVTNKKTGSMRAFSPPLSSHILAGTTRDRVIQVLKDGVMTSGQKIEQVMEAPKKEFIIDSLKGRTNWEVSAIIFMGTGVGMIHARSLTNNPALRDWMACNELRSEESLPDPLILRSIRETEKRYPINSGNRHPFVDDLKKSYESYVLGDNGSRIVPAYHAVRDISALEKVFGVGIDEFADKDFRKKAEGGYFQERINGLKQPDEIHERTRLVAKTLKKAIDISVERRTTLPAQKTKAG
jgi:branched-subunit amino acid aminotransferase/4-amino-4-deoxychorismate lyase